MEFRARAAIVAAVISSVAAFGAASTPGYAVQVKNPQIQSVNVQEPLQVPAIQAVTPATPETIEPETGIADTAGDQDFDTLSEAVAAQPMPVAIDDELNCLATSIYYEAKGEPLAGQLAVAHVVLNRAASGRFPASVCGVIKQRGQFSFVRGGRLPTPPECAQWRKAVAVAEVARKDLWENPVPDALFFHATYVNAAWRMAPVARLGNHIFYR